MTVNELIRELQSIDDDLKQYDIVIYSHIILGRDVKLTAKSKLVRVDENADIDKSQIALLSTNIISEVP